MRFALLLFIGIFVWRESAAMPMHDAASLGEDIELLKSLLVDRKREKKSRRKRATDMPASMGETDAQPAVGSTFRHFSLEADESAKMLDRNEEIASYAMPKISSNTRTQLKRRKQGDKRSNKHQLQESLQEAEVTESDTALSEGQSSELKNWIDWCQFRGLMGKSCTKKCHKEHELYESLFKCKKSGNLFAKGRARSQWCVPAETRCDATANCADGSDEEDCPATCSLDSMYEELYSQQECLPVLQGLSCVDKNLKGCEKLTNDEICPCFNKIGTDKLKACNLMLPTFAFSVSELATKQCLPM